MSRTRRKEHKIMVMVEETKKWQKRQDNKIFHGRCPKGLLAYKPSSFDDYLIGYPIKEGDMEVKPFAYIATGIDGEHWAIDKDVFEHTYERVE